MTTTTTAPAAVKLPIRKIAKDSQGRTYVHTQRVAISPTEKVALVVHILSNPNPASGRFAESKFDLHRLIPATEADPAVIKIIRNAIHQKGTALTAKGLRAKNLQAACRIALEMAKPGDVVKTRARRTAARPTTPRRSTRQSAPAAPAEGGPALSAQLAASIAAQHAERDATVNAAPSAGGGSETARRAPVQGPKRETAKQRRAREARERTAAATAAAAATVEQIDAALTTPPAPVTEGAAADTTTE
jgi:hypothetical protein